MKTVPRRGLETLLENPQVMAKRGAAVMLGLLLCSLALASTSANTTVVQDETRVLIHGEAGASWTTTLDLDASHLGLFWISCIACEATVSDAQDNTLVQETGGMEHIHVAEVSATLTLTITFVDEESAEVVTFASTMATLSDRPAPGAVAATTTLAMSQTGDLWWSGVHPVQLNAVWSGASTGVLNVSADTSAYMLAKTEGPAWVDLLLHHTSSEINLRLIIQNDTSETNHLMHTLQGATLPYAHRLALDEGERVLIMVEGTAPSTAVALTMAAHPMAGAMEHLQDLEHIIGHGGQIKAIDVNETDAVHLSPAEGTELLVHHLVQGAWIATSSEPISSATTVWPLPGTEALRLSCHSPVCASGLSLTSASDLGSGSDAQGHVDVSDGALLDGDSTGHLPLNGSGSGHLVRATHDVADVLPFFIDAWEESIHLVKVSVWSSEPVRVELIPIDPITGLIDEEERTLETLDGQGQSLSAQFGRGAHLVRISVIDADEVLNTTWGSEGVTLNYTLEMAHGVVDEGDEPWFEPDEASQIWGARVRWILGFCFLIPVAYLAHIQRRRTRLANLMRVQRERLRSIVKRLDEGRPVEQERRDLHLALDAVATLEFEEACRSWGEPELSHRTDEIALAAWRLDPRLAKEGTHVLLVGLAAGPQTWEATALRFDAPLGAACEVKAVEPRFLHHGEDVFLDTLRANTIVFLTVELDGVGSMVDLEVNGLVEAEPRAARATTSLVLDADEEA